MIYLLAVALIAAICGFAYQSRQKGFRALATDMAATAICGLLSGLLIGVGARTGMLAIAFVNGDALRLAVWETVRVIAIYACLGIAFGLIYEGLLRRVLRQKGYIYGVLIALFAAYPLVNVAAQLLTKEISIVWLYTATFGVAFLIFVSFGWCLEMLLRRYYLRQLEISGL